MNILVVSSSGLYSKYSYSFVHNQAKAYAALGHRVRVLVPLAIGKRYDGGTRFGPPVAIVHQDGVEVCYVRNLSLSNLGEPKFNRVTALASIQLMWHWIFSDFKPDVVHTHTISLGVVGGYLKNRFGIPLVITTHGGDTDVAVKGEKACKETRNIGKIADRIVAVSSSLARKLETCQIKDKTVVILNGFSVERMCTSKKNTFSVVQVGNLLPSKRVNITIQSVCWLKSLFPEITLDIIGSGPEEWSLKKLCIEHGATEYIRFLGKLSNDEVMKQMAQSQFFVMPSSPEGFGIVYLEAMASGCITIGTEGEGIADLIVSGENGFLVPPDDVDAIVRVIDYCLQNKVEMNSIAEAGRCSALQLTWEKNAVQYIELFNQLRGES